PEDFWIQREDGEICKLVALAIKKFIVVDLMVGSENPLALWIQIGLCRLTLDLITESILPLISMRQIKLVEEEQRERQHRCQGDHRHDEPIEANAGGLHCGELV